MLPGELRFVRITGREAPGGQPPPTPDLPSEIIAGILPLAHELAAHALQDQKAVVAKISGHEVELSAPAAAELALDGRAVARFL